MRDHKISNTPASSFLVSSHSFIHSAESIAPFVRLSSALSDRLFKILNHDRTADGSSDSLKVMYDWCSFRDRVFLFVDKRTSAVHFLCHRCTTDHKNVNFVPNESHSQRNSRHYNGINCNSKSISQSLMPSHCFLFNLRSTPLIDGNKSAVSFIRCNQSTFRHIRSKGTQSKRNPLRFILRWKRGRSILREYRYLVGFKIVPSHRRRRKHLVLNHYRAVDASSFHSSVALRR